MFTKGTVLSSCIDIDWYGDNDQATALSQWNMRTTSCNVYNFLNKG